MTQKHILIIEDETELLMMMQSFLSIDGYAVTEATSPAKALQILDNGGAFDLIITDLELPGMKGMELISELVARAPNTPIMVSTGHKDKQSEAQQRGAMYYLRKPFGYGELSAAVKAIFQG